MGYTYTPKQPAKNSMIASTRSVLNMNLLNMAPHILKILMLASIAVAIAGYIQIAEAKTSSAVLMSVSASTNVASSIKHSTIDMKGLV